MIVKLRCVTSADMISPRISELLTSVLKEVRLGNSVFPELKFKTIIISTVESGETKSPEI